MSGAALLQSTDIEDNLLAVLTRLQDQRAIVQDVLRRIAELPESSRRHAFAQFLIISGLRRLEETVREEAHKMPILNDLLSHKVIGPAILQGRQEGREEGRQEGVQEVVRTLIGKRFGSVPEWVDNRLTNLSVSELDAIAVRLLDVPSLDLLFPGATK